MDAEPRVEDARLSNAEAFLQEAVYRSRERQAGGVMLSGSPANCGLGNETAVELDLSERGRELFHALFGDEGMSQEALGRVHGIMEDWIRKQDALDRKRNHFLKDFRHEHGFDRAQYEPHVANAYRSGLDRVNSEIDDERRRAAAALTTLA